MKYYQDRVDYVKNALPGQMVTIGAAWINPDKTMNIKLDFCLSPNRSLMFEPVEKKYPAQPDYVLKVQKQFLNPVDEDMKEEQYEI